MLRVLTLNLWGTNPPLAERMAGLVGYLRRERPQIVALQEVGEWDGHPQAQRVADAAGYPTVQQIRTGNRLRRGEGLAILTDGEAEPAATVSLPSSVIDHPRALQQVDVVVGERVVRVANTHLAWRREATALRVAQAEAIADALTEWNGPIVLLGDLNDVAASPPLRVLTAAGGAGLTDCYAAVRDDEPATLDLDNPYNWQPELAGRRIDHVLARGWRVLDAAVVLTGDDAPVVSDHYGVTAVLQPAAAA